MNDVPFEELRTMGSLRNDAQAQRAHGCAIDARAFVSDDVHLGRGVSVGPMATVVADEAPYVATVLADGAQVGANATVAAGCTVGFRARVAPGAVVLRSVPPLAIVEGNPGKIKGYVDSPQSAASRSAPASAAAQPGHAVASRVRGVTLHALRTIPDLRGTLTPGEFGKDVPFAVERFFLVYGVPSSETRGEHAHHRCKQFLLAVSGSVQVLVDDGQRREEFTLDRAGVGLYIPPMVWGVQYRYTADCVLLVFASEPYDAKDYIRDYAHFLALARATPEAASRSKDRRAARPPAAGQQAPAVGPREFV